MLVVTCYQTEGGGTFITAHEVLGGVNFAQAEEIVRDYHRFHDDTIIALETAPRHNQLTPEAVKNLREDLANKDKDTD